MPQDERSYFYFDIPKQARDSAISYLLHALLKSRSACQLPSNQDQFDEDVNIYLAHLLFACSLPDYLGAVNRYLSMNVSEMTNLIEQNDDRIVRYFIYKVNADHLMVHLGIFQDLENEHRLFRKSEPQFSSMAQSYYRQAASYNRRIYRRETAIGSVLEKLAVGFDRYKRILRFARKEFFHFTNRFQDESFEQFCNAVDRYEREERLNGAIDRFLDSYAEWLKVKDPAARLRLIDYARALQKLDPEFSFNFEGEAEAA
ncbi:MAG: hypothetical protein HY584_06070 [Candidatus Omnitrophica bacterium]|nr:hypothetical protein [Candidatus Omnitrophota bacterium]